MSNVESVQAIYEAFGRGDIAAILDQLADDVGWDLDAPGYGVPIYEPGVGKEHAKRFFEALGDLEFLQFEPTNFLSGGDQVAVPINIKVTVKATGKTVEALEVHLWTFGDDGKVSRFFHAIDRHAFVLAYDL
jgi:ketosteroid isomerase-like protein